MASRGGRRDTPPPGIDAQRSVEGPKRQGRVPGLNDKTINGDPTDTVHTAVFYAGPIRKHEPVERLPKPLGRRDYWTIGRQVLHEERLERLDELPSDISDKDAAVVLAGLRDLARQEIAKHRKELRSLAARAKKHTARAEDELRRRDALKDEVAKARRELSGLANQAQTAGGEIKTAKSRAAEVVNDAERRAGKIVEAAEREARARSAQLLNAATVEAKTLREQSVIPLRYGLDLLPHIEAALRKSTDAARLPGHIQEDHGALVGSLREWQAMIRAATPKKRKAKASAPTD